MRPGLRTAPRSTFVHDHALSDRDVPSRHAYVCGVCGGGGRGRANTIQTNHVAGKDGVIDTLTSVALNSGTDLASK